MEQTRKEQLSIYYWVADLFPSFVNVVDEFPTDELTLPTIAVIRNSNVSRPFELGGDNLTHKRWAIYVFAQNSGQRDDYLDRIAVQVEDNICVYNYGEGFPPEISPTQVGSLQVEDIESKPLRVYEELIKKKYWWGSVTFTTYFSPV